MKAVQLTGVGKKYLVSHEKQALIRHILPSILKIKDYEEFWALKDIDLTIDKGNSLAIVGPNGAGKTTLLNILAGITIPTEGLLKVEGKVSALLGLGAGFHPELTGEENIYLNASILGLKALEVRKKFDQIVSFSELGNFINAPLKTYSAGMCMRLGFAVAVHVDFDILLIDEILSVGDLSFQEKCINKLKEFRNQGRTLLMVSQSMGLIKDLSDLAVFLNRGKIELFDRTEKVIDYYENKIAKTHIESSPRPEEPPAVKKVIKEPVADHPISIDQYFKTRTIVAKEGWGTKSGNKDLLITKVRFLNGFRRQTNTFRTGDRLKVIVDYTVNKEIENPHFGVAIFREDGLYCYGPNTRFDNMNFKKLKKGKGKFCIEYKRLNLPPGKYRVSVVVWEKDEKFAYDYHNAYYNFTVISDKMDHGVLFLDHKWRCKLP